MNNKWMRDKFYEQDFWQGVKDCLPAVAITVFYLVLAVIAWRGVT